MAEDLFIYEIDTAEELYRIIRDEKRCAEYKSYMLGLWETYSPYADRDFPQQLAQDFHARFWEMYLTCTLVHNSFNVVPKQTSAKGPDILIDDLSRRIYIEAVAPSVGADDNVDRVPPSQFNTFKAERLPDIEITLRYSGAIADKYRQYKKYLEYGILSPSDSYVIALNSCKIGIRAKLEATGFPRIVKAVLPVGNIEVPINRISGAELPWHHQYRPNIPRSSGSDVPTDLFLRDDYAGISGVLYSHSDVANRPNQAGDEFIFIHNPKSQQNAVPHEYFKLGVEYFTKLGHDGFSVSSKEWCKNRG